MLELTICDPACGSGAFLNQALEFLINEHHTIDELNARLFGSTMVFRDVENQILENNLFGVDINEESVDIARLSLWLRTAQRGRKLTTLNKNIKCGNSLIDDPAVAGDKAFKWEEEFPYVFQPKKKEAWHVTFALHNSRYAGKILEGGITDGVTRQLRKEEGPGFMGYTHLELSEEEEIILAEEMENAAKKYALNILECTICADHVHAIIVCEEEELPVLVGKWKGRAAYTYNRRVNPSVDDDDASYADGTKEKFWAKSFHKRLIDNPKQLENTINYIRNNRHKHELPAATDGLTRPLANIRCTYEHAFRTEYKGGFDVVIGNPPWGAKVAVGIALWLLKKYPVVPSKLKDTYMYFQLLSINILNSKGILGLIVPNTWLLINNTADYRQELLEYNVQEITDHGDGVFSDAIVESATIILKKEIFQNGKVLARKYRKNNELANQYVDKNIWLSDDYNRIVLELNLHVQKLIDRINQLAKPFSENSEIIFGIKPYQVGHGTPPQTQEIINNRIFHSDRKINDQWKPLVVGTDITRYYCIFPGNQYIKYGEWLMYPSNERKILNPKILLRRTSYDIKAAFDDQNYYPQNSVFIITSSYNLKYLLAVLNSRLMDCIYKNKCPQEGKIFAEIKPSIIKSLPIINPNKKEESAVESSVDLLIEKQNNLSIYKLQIINLIISKFQIDKISK